MQNASQKNKTIIWSYLISLDHADQGWSNLIKLMGADQIDVFHQMWINILKAKTIGVYQYCNQYWQYLIFARNTHFDQYHFTIKNQYPDRYQYQYS